MSRNLVFAQSVSHSWLFGGGRIPETGSFVLVWAICFSLFSAVAVVAGECTWELASCFYLRSSSGLL